MAEISLTDYAKIRDLSRNAVVRAIENGRLKTSVRVEKRQGVRDKIWITDVALANREWEMNTSSKHKPRSLGNDAIATAATAPPPPRNPVGRPPVNRPVTEDNRHRPADIDPHAFDAPDAIDPATGVPKVSVSRARKEHFDAMQAQTKAEQLAGTLINREEVTRAAFSVAREVRDALLQIKDRLADELATMTDANQISKHLDTEFRHALAKLSGEIAVDGPHVG